MGVNNRARRAAKKRKPAPRRVPASRRVQASRAERADALVAEAVLRCTEDLGGAARVATAVLAVDGLRAAVGVAMTHRLHAAAELAVRRGWSPHDLANLQRRRLTDEHRPLLAAALRQATKRHPAARVAQQWNAELMALGTSDHPALDDQHGLALALATTAALLSVPEIPVLLSRPGDAEPLANVEADALGSDARLLGRVRALLAKAESTEFEHEAEAFSAKAQELISRHSLGHLVGAAATAGAGAKILARRLWLDPPYLSAKAALVHEVARANRCSTVLAERLGFITVAGAAADIEAVDLLTTSLLVQAGAAMLAAGSRYDGYGTSRTASFRRSFLLAYAHRIGERLRAADRTVGIEVAASVGAALVPVVQDHSDRVEAALAQIYPQVVKRRTRVGNWQGWAEGRAAADLARLHANRAIPP